MRTYALIPRHLGAITISDLEKMPSCDINVGSEAANGIYKSCCEEIKRQAKIPRTSMDLAQALKKIAECAGSATKAAVAEAVCVNAKTGMSTIDDALEKCCKVAATGTGNFGDRAKQLALCAANAAANAAVTVAAAAIGTAACAAAGAVTAGITTVLAATGICGIIAGAVGSFLYNRIAGYGAGSLIVGGIAAAVCGALSGGGLALVCGFLAAELTQWLSDTLGPVLDGIFHPGRAAERRAYEERMALHAARDGVEKMLKMAPPGSPPPPNLGVFQGVITNTYQSADVHIAQAWSASILRLWDLYDKAFPDKALRDAAAKDLSLTGTYHSIALKLYTMSAQIASGAQAKLSQEQKDLLIEAGSLPDVIPIYLWQPPVKNPDAWGCERYGRLQSDGRPVGWPTNQPGTINPRSPLCPLLPTWDFFVRDSEKHEFKTVDDYHRVGEEYLAKIKNFFRMLPETEALVAQQITAYATAKAVQIKLQFQATASNLMMSIRSNAVKAQAAAIAAAHGGEEDSARNVAKAERAADVASQAYEALVALVNQGSDVWPTAKARIDSVKTVEAAKASVALAHKNHEANKRNRLLFGAVIVAGVGASAYMLMKRNA